MRGKASLLLVLGTFVIILGFIFAIGNSYNIQKNFGGQLAEEYSSYNRFLYIAYVYTDYLVRYSSLNYISDFLVSYDPSVISNGYYSCQKYEIYDLNTEGNNIYYQPCIPMFYIYSYSSQSGNLYQNYLPLPSEINDNILYYVNSYLESNENNEYYQESEIGNDYNITVVFNYSYITEIYNRSLILSIDYSLKPYMLAWNCYSYELYKFAYNSLLNFSSNPGEALNNIESENGYLYIQFYYHPSFLDILNMYNQMVDNSAQFEFDVVLPCNYLGISCDVKKNSEGETYYYECLEDQKTKQTSSENFLDIRYQGTVADPTSYSIQIMSPPYDVDFNQLNRTIYLYGFLCPESIENLSEYPLLQPAEVEINYTTLTCIIGYVEKTECFSDAGDCYIARGSINADGFYIKDLTNCQQINNQYCFSYEQREKFLNPIGNQQVNYFIFSPYNS